MTYILLRNALILNLFVCFASSSFAQENYPVPPRTDKMLFYFQRSHNRNTVIYEINNLPDGHINTSKPVNFYWIRYEEGGTRKELSLVQRKAFGVQCKLMDRKKESFILHFNNFKKRDIYLFKLKDSTQYHAYVNINGEISELKKMFIKSENNSIGIPLSVKYVEITGINLRTGKDITERYVP